ncbi:MAG: helix-turn-helix domain-containing protein [Clostridiales bacterium]|nr:helix-turn-helix domain-containing protein [Clostridiales bacterium]
MNVKQIIADNLTELRRAQGLTQSELAAKLHYSDKAVSKWERAEALPDTEVLYDIAMLYGVTLDYLVSDHKDTPPEVQSVRKRNRIIITMLSVLLVWGIAVILYVNLKIALKINYWLVFIWACPITSIVLIVFNGIWGKRPWTFVLVSVLVWTFLASLYLQFLKYNIWSVFLIGAPAQIAIIMWSNLRSPRKVPTRNKDPKEHRDEDKSE